jgi:DNA-binding NarL/FixJ family response regulator
MKYNRSFDNNLHNVCFFFTIDRCIQSMNKIYSPSRVTGDLLAGGAVPNNSLDRLTERQRNVLFLLCKGFSNPEIAAQVELSPRIVKQCVSQLLLIYEASNRTELAGLLGAAGGALCKGAVHLDRAAGHCD